MRWPPKAHGLTGKAADIANNPKAMAQAIAADPELAKVAARAAIETHPTVVVKAQDEVAVERMADYDRARGVDPDRPMPTFAGELTVEAGRIDDVLHSIAGRITKLILRCEPDQVDRVRAMFQPGLDDIALATSRVPDTIEGLT